MATRRERLERRAERRREWADSRSAASSASFERAHGIADGIPFGQPILVGHHSERRARRDQERIVSGMSAGVEHARKAEEHADKAAGIEAQLAGAIFSDDADAPERLAERIAELEAERDRIKAYNASCRRGARDVSLLDAKQQEDLATVARVQSYALGSRGEFPAYALQNLGGNIRRNRQRLEEITRTREMVAAGDRGRGREMVSRFASSCADCGGEIAKGSPIVYFRVTREAVHANCEEV